MKVINSSLISFLIITLLFPVPGYAKDSPAQPLQDERSLSGYPLSLEEALRLTLQNNFDIHMARIERSVNTYEIQSARSVYDTTLSANFDYTVDEKEQSSSILPSKQNITNWNLGLAKKLFTGTTLGLDFLNKRTSAPSTFSSMSPYYNSDIQASVNQPLLKNSFGLIDRATVTLVKLDVSRLDLTILDRIEENIAGVYGTYWDLVFAHGNAEAKKDALLHAEEFLKITKQQFDNGAVEETDLFAAEANVAIKTSDFLTAQNNVFDTSDDLKFAMNFFTEYTLRPIDVPVLNNVNLDSDTNIVRALERRRDLRAAEIALQSNNVTLKIKKNSRLPELDLIGTFTANGLDRDMIDAVGEAAGLDDPTYLVGAEFSIPLENRKARAEHSQTELEKAKALWDLKKIEKQIVVDINESLREIVLKDKQVFHNEKAKTLQEKKLKGEEKKYGFGRSSSDIIIRFEDDVINARIAYIQALTDYAKAVVALKRNQNTLLDDIDWITYENINSHEFKKPN